MKQRRMVMLALLARIVGAQTTDTSDAFHDSTARATLLRARAARLSADSALSGYDAQSYQRIALNYGTTIVGRDRMMFGFESVGRVQWRLGRGAAIEIQGARTFGVTGDLTPPVPYYPGLEALWMNAGPMEESIRPLALENPLIPGAEAHYTYASGDLLTIRIGTGTPIRVRELRVRPRRPHVQLVVGSFWFDEATGQLVRAAYRPSEPINVWSVMRESSDSAVRAGARGPSAWIAKFFTNPAVARISAVAVDYGLYEGRFWLPRTRTLTANGQAGFVTGTMRIEQRFTYSAVNPRDTIAEIVVRGRSVNSDTLRGAVKVAAVEGLMADTVGGCAQGDRYTITRMKDNVPIRMRAPCNRASLVRSSELPPSIFAPATDLASKEADALVGLALGLDAQAPLFSAIPRPSFQYGLAWTRFNRVEGLSLGGEIDQSLGGGYALRGLGRFGTGDRWTNAELGLLRGNLTDSIELRGFRRLSAANDWGQPLGFTSSLAAGLFGRDNGFYYRATGAELLGGHDASFARGAHVAWRLFAESQDSATVTVSRGLGGRFGPNVLADHGTWYGGSARLTHTSDLDPRHLRFLTDARIEAAAGETGYGRASLDVTASRPLGPVVGALTLAGGSSLGTLPAQRRWFLGGAETIRGQVADTAASGNAFWLTRAEINPRIGLVNRVFADFGWAGDRTWRDAFRRPSSGVGVGWSLIDGLARFDVARGIYPRKAWRVELYVGARY